MTTTAKTVLGRDRCGCGSNSSRCCRQGPRPDAIPDVPSGTAFPAAIGLPAGERDHAFGVLGTPASAPGEPAWSQNRSGRRSPASALHVRHFLVDLVGGLRTAPHVLSAPRFLRLLDDGAIRRLLRTLAWTFGSSTPRQDLVEIEPRLIWLASAPLSALGGALGFARFLAPACAGSSPLALHEVVATPPRSPGPSTQPDEGRAACRPRRARRRRAIELAGRVWAARAARRSRSLRRDVRHYVHAIATSAPAPRSKVPRDHSSEPARGDHQREPAARLTCSSSTRNRSAL